jgi:2-dehydro-3-deoxy-D-gluconate 5-dehydrogenase
MSYITQLFDLTGKIAIVTGASRGLGRGAAQALAGAGAQVICVGRDLEALKETGASLPQERATLMQADVTHPEQMATVVDQVLREHEQIDILVNNAGIIKRATAIEYSGEDWNSVIDTNLNSVFGWSQTVGKSMIERGSGKIINIASLLSFTGGINVAAYAAAKGGVAQLTKALSNEWSKYNVQVNAIAPGYFITDATSALRNNAERSKQILSRIPAGRWGEPEDLAGAFIFLASAASDYVSGHILTVDGGFLGY